MLDKDALKKEIETIMAPGCKAIFSALTEALADAFAKGVEFGLKQVLTEPDADNR